MIDFLVRRFVPDHERINDPAVRRSYGLLSGTVGIICNVLLSVVKLIVGIISGSIAVISDAFNNISDVVSSLVTIFGYRAASKPADKEHPFGHGRTEYLASLMIGVVIMYLGVSLFVTSVRKIISPVPIKPDAAALAILFAAILMKVWLTVFNKKLGERINSPVMLATSQDARNDVITTSAAFVGMAAAYFTDLPLDGVMGAVVSIYVTISGVNVLRETADDIIGRPGSSDMIGRINEIVSHHSRILGIHDVLIHDYGPGRVLASCHAEVDAEERLMEIHEIIDDAEREIERELGIHITMHIDPVDMSDPRLKEYRDILQGEADRVCPGADVHDLHIAHEDTAPTITFDLLLPYGYKDPKQAERDILSFAQERFESYRIILTVEHGLDGGL
ncbi:MAG: cation transporter [Oscillospiraceae bacterium]|nr:cation transporter [Oscillospiraceae bacterium]